MKNVDIVEYDPHEHFDALNVLIGGFREFVKVIQPDIARSDNDFDLNHYCDYLVQFTREHVIYLAFWDKEPVGYITVFATRDNSSSVYRPYSYAILHELFISADHRRKGIGNKLVNYAKKWSAENECEFIQVGYAAHNKKAKRFYNRGAGFALYGKISRIRL